MKETNDRLALLRLFDPEVSDAIDKERDRQHSKLEMIASENFVSEAVMEAAGSVLTNKYAEGYPGNRYYGGCEFVDIIEDLARERVKKLYGAEYANVQPHSGSQANQAVYIAMLNPGDRVMGMDLAHGGHLTHGSPVNLSGKFYEFYSYGIDPETGRIDYNKVKETALKVKPKMIVAGASAYPRQIDFQAFASIAEEAGAYLMVDMAHIAGLVAAGLHPSPVPYAHFVTSTTHKTLRGPRGGLILCRQEFGRAVDKAIFPGIQGGPMMHIIAAKAVCFREAQQEEFVVYQQQVIRNAKMLASELKTLGYDLVSGGTENHMLLLDLRSKGITGKWAEERLDAVGITVNKNAIPFDPQPPRITSGLRIGTPALTSRGMKENEMKLVAGLIDQALSSGDNEVSAASVLKQIRQLCNQFPLYQGRA